METTIMGYIGDYTQLQDGRYVHRNWPLGKADVDNRVPKP